MKRFNLFLWTILLISIASFSQQDIETTGQTVNKKATRKSERKNRPAYIGISGGFGFSSLRDFATSPLTYYGIQGQFSMYFLKADLKKEMETGLIYSLTGYGNNYNENLSIGTGSSAQIYYSQLYRFNPWSSDKLNIKVGGLFNTVANFRYNPSFLNNSVGIDIIPTVFGSAKIEKVFIKESKPVRRFLFFKYTKSNLSYRLNIGIINSSYRNGYAYSDHSAIVNDPELFNNYEFDIFSGFRMNSAIDYTLTLENKNQIQFSYLWDAYRTNTYDDLEVASHVIRIALLFNTNNK